MMVLDCNVRCLHRIDVCEQLLQPKKPLPGKLCIVHFITIPDVADIVMLDSIQEINDLVLHSVGSQLKP